MCRLLLLKQMFVVIRLLVVTKSISLLLGDIIDMFLFMSVVTYMLLVPLMVSESSSCRFGKLCRYGNGLSGVGGSSILGVAMWWCMMWLFCVLV